MWNRKSPRYEDNDFFNNEKWEIYNLCNYFENLDFYSFEDRTDEIAWISNDLLKNIATALNKDDFNTHFSLDWLNQKSFSFEYVGDLELDLVIKYHDRIFACSYRI